MTRRSVRWILCVTALGATVGCSTGPTRVSAPATTRDVAKAGPDAFIGAWRSVTPSYEFIGLSVVSKSSEMGALAARLTLSGVAWEGGARVDADSLVMTMTVAGTSANSVMIARSGRAGRLLLLLPQPGAAPINLEFVRQD